MVKLAQIQMQAQDRQSGVKRYNLRRRPLKSLDQKNPEPVKKKIRAPKPPKQFIKCLWESKRYSPSKKIVEHLFKTYLGSKNERFSPIQISKATNTRRYVPRAVSIIRIFESINVVKRIFSQENTQVYEWIGLESSLPFFQNTSEEIFERPVTTIRECTNLFLRKLKFRQKLQHKTQFTIDQIAKSHVKRKKSILTYQIPFHIAGKITMVFERLGLVKLVRTPKVFKYTVFQWKGVGQLKELISKISSQKNIQENVSEHKLKVEKVEAKAEPQKAIKASKKNQIYEQSEQDEQDEDAQEQK